MWLGESLAGSMSYNLHIRKQQNWLARSHSIVSAGRDSPVVSMYDHLHIRETIRNSWLGVILLCLLEEIVLLFLCMTIYI